MSNELVHEESVSSLLSSVAPEVNDSNIELLAEMRYLPQFSIASGQSKIVTVHNLAQVGDFIVGKSSLGRKVTVCPIHYRSKAQVVDKDKQEVLETLVRLANAGDLTQDPEWVALESKYPKSRTQTADYQRGVELLLFIPEMSLFATFFCKNTLAEIGVDMWKKGAGMACDLSTFYYEGKYKSWWKFRFEVMDVSVLGYPGDLPNPQIDLDARKLSKALKLFSTVEETVKTADEEDSSFAR